jgi:SNF2 family DNA or RNA helicase
MSYRKHQEESLDRMDGQTAFMDFSDAGTGKTRVHAGDFYRRGKGRLLVLAPKSALQSAWGDELDKVFPGLSYVVARAENREKAFNLNTDVVLTNHDAVTWAIKNKKLLSGFDSLVVDESTAYKNPQAQRSKAALAISKQMQYVRSLCATPNPNSVLELFHQTLITDKGERLGTSYWKFRNAVCEPIQIGPRPEMIEWRDKPGAEAAVFAALADISIRHKLEECADMPEMTVRNIHFDISKKCRAAYDDMKRHAMIVHGDQNITAINKATVVGKLLQIASGALYTGVEDEYVVLDEERAQLVMDLVEERQHTVVAFQWRHQRDLMVAEAKKRGLSYAVIDGEAKDRDRTKAINDFQAGALRVIFLQPQSAAHSITLTKGTTTIWASPTSRPDLYKQLNHRIYRTGQTQKTEVIRVCAKGTRDEHVYEMLEQGLNSMDLFLSFVEAA